MKTYIPTVIERLETIYNIANKSKDDAIKEIAIICEDLKDWLKVKYKEWMGNNANKQKKFQASLSESQIVTNLLKRDFKVNEYLWEKTTNELENTNAEIRKFNFELMKKNTKLARENKQLKRNDIMERDEIMKALNKLTKAVENNAKLIIAYS